CSAAGGHHSYLFVADVAPDMIVFPIIAVRDNYGPGGVCHNVIEPGGIDVREIEDHAEPFAFSDQFTSELGQSFGRRSCRRKDSAAAGRIASRVSQAKQAQSQFVKNAKQIKIGAEWLRSLHRN